MNPKFFLKIGVIWKYAWSKLWTSGAEAMKVCEQDPPKSGVDLEGAWCVWN